MFWNIKMLENTAECLFLCLYLITWEHACWVKCVRKSLNSPPPQQSHLGMPWIPPLPVMNKPKFRFGKGMSNKSVKTPKEHITYTLNFLYILHSEKSLATAFEIKGSSSNVAWADFSPKPDPKLGFLNSHLTGSWSLLLRKAANHMKIAHSDKQKVKVRSLSWHKVLMNKEQK